MLLASDIVKFDLSTVVVFLICAFCLLMLFIVLFFNALRKLDMQRSAHKGTLDDDLKEKKTAAMMAEVRNQLVGISCDGEPPATRLLLRPDPIRGVIWTDTITWQVGDDHVEARINWPGLDCVKVVSTARGHDQPPYIFGNGLVSVTKAPACVRQILGDPEPEPEKSVGTSS